jgi:hypothetical protein
MLRAGRRACLLVLAASIAACGSAPTPRADSPGDHRMTVDKLTVMGEKAIKEEKPGAQNTDSAAAPAADDAGKTFDRIPRDAKVALSTHPFVEPSIVAPSTIPSKLEGLQNAGRVAGGAALGAAGGAVQGALYGLQCGIFFWLCSPIMAAAGAVIGAVGGAAGTADRIGTSSSEGVDNPTAETLSTLGEKVGGTWTPQAHDAAAATPAEGPVAPNSLGERIYRLAHEQGLTALALIGDSTHETPSSTPQYSGKADYVFEVAVWRLVQAFESDSDLWKLQVDAEGRLVRVGDNVVIARFEKQVLSSVTFRSAATDSSELYAAFDESTQRLAKAFVQDWIGPALRYQPIAMEPTPVAHASPQTEADPSLVQGETATSEAPAAREPTPDPSMPKDEPGVQPTAALESRPPAQASEPQPAAAAEPAPARIQGLRTGDRWEYRLVDSRKGTPEARRFEIVDLDGDTIVEQIDAGAGEQRTATQHPGEYLSLAGGMQFAPYYAAFHENVTDRSDTDLRVEGGDACETRIVGGGDYAAMIECQIGAEFAGIEMVTVPAGTFQARVVRVTVVSQVFGALKRRETVVEARYWISPETKRIVKAVVHYEAAHPWTETMELVAYPVRGESTATAR